MGNEFIKEISEMNLEQITERKAELETEIRSAESKESLEGMEEKINAINTRIAELKEFETRKAQAEALQNNVVVPDKTIEETRKEEGKMVDYRTAFLKTMLGKELDVEERAAYSTLTNWIYRKYVPDCTFPHSQGLSAYYCFEFFYVKITHGQGWVLANGIIKNILSAYKMHKPELKEVYNE